MTRRCQKNGIWQKKRRLSMSKRLRNIEDGGREKKRGKRGLGSVEELWVNKACCGEDERDS